MNKRFYALGRLKSGEMNRVEKQYAIYLEAQKQAGEILWFKFEPIKFRLAKATFYDVDFLVLNKAAELEVHEVKGARAIFMDDAKVKVKVAAELFPMKFFVVYPKKKASGWDIEQVK